MPLGDYGTTASRYVYSPARAPSTRGAARLLIGSELTVCVGSARPAGLSRLKDAQFDQSRCRLVDPAYLSGFEAHTQGLVDVAGAVIKEGDVLISAAGERSDPLEDSPAPASATPTRGTKRRRRTAGRDPNCV